jgi:hypothetical protein
MQAARFRHRRSRRTASVMTRRSVLSASTIAAVGSEACALCRLKLSFLRSINRSGDFQLAFRVLMRDFFIYGCRRRVGIIDLR